MGSWVFFAPGKVIFTKIRKKYFIDSLYPPLGGGGGGVGGGTSIDFTEILGTFGFFPENKFFGHPNYEKYNIYPKNGDCDPS